MVQDLLKPNLEMDCTLIAAAQMVSVHFSINYFKQDWSEIIIVRDVVPDKV